ncbi:hypothetical protein niasHS_000879 [Heterodera schachtii]|uniref:Phosphoglycerate mutase n=1 Tax=Heterodera schachtii TaxID=97005 RepID=A0ABD2KMP9_HETSC
MCRRRKCRAANVGAANVFAASVCAACVALTGRRKCQRLKSKNIVVVSHCGLIATIHELLTGEEVSCGQATVSKFVQYAENKNTNAHDDDDDTVDVLKQYHLEYSSDSSHLTEHSNLRPF